MVRYEVIREFLDIDNVVKSVGTILAMDRGRGNKLVSQGYLLPIATTSVESRLVALQNATAVVDGKVDTADAKIVVVDGKADAIKAVTDNIPAGIQNILNDVKGAAISYDNLRYAQLLITFDASTTGAVATHPIFTVTGLVRIRMVIECITDLTEGGATATIALGVTNTTNAFIAVTDAVDIDAGHLWYGATPDTNNDFDTAVLDKVINGETEDIVYAVAAETITGGVIIIHYWWEALDENGSVVPV